MHNETKEQIIADLQINLRWWFLEKMTTAEFFRRVAAVELLTKRTVDQF